MTDWDEGSPLGDRTDMAMYITGMSRMVNFMPPVAPVFEYVMTIPEEYGEIVRLAAHTNRRGEQCLFALCQNGKTYLVDAEAKQMIEAIAPKGTFT